METRKYSWKAEWLAADLNPGNVSDDDLKMAAELRLENERFLMNHPAHEQVPQILAKNSKKSSVRVPLWGIVSFPLAAAAVLAVMLTGLQISGPESSEHLKGGGGAKLFIYRETSNGKAESLQPEVHVTAGDRLQASYFAPTPLQGAILSIDGDRNIMVHLASEGRSVSLVPGKENPLSYSYELDKAPQYEVFFLFTSEHPFEIENLKKILVSKPWRNLGTSDFGSQISWTAFPLKKDFP